MNVVGALIGVALAIFAAYILIMTFAVMPAFLAVGLARRSHNSGTP